MKSRVTGKGKASPFDTDKVQLMQKVLLAKVYPEMGKEVDSIYQECVAISLFVLCQQNENRIIPIYTDPHPI